jgi:peptide deformylase
MNKDNRKKINQVGSSVLDNKSEKVENIKSQKTQKIISEMRETLLSMDNALALAAPQIGYNKQIIIIKETKDENIDLTELVIINPEVIFTSKKVTVADEGCLSVAEPEIRGEVKRSQKITIKYLNEDGELKKLKANDLLARVIQHELDHLNGLLFLDRADPTTIYQINKSDEESIKK